MLSMMRALPLLIVIGGLLGCTVDGGNARDDRSAGYRGWPHFQTLDYRGNLTAAVTSAFPKISPLVLKRRAQAFDNPDWLFELEYDGFRALLEIDGSGVRLLARGLRKLRPG